MSWVKLDDHFDDHPKVISAGPLAMALHVAALCWCNRNLTDGFIPRGQVSRLIDTTEFGVNPHDLAKKLVVAVLWDEDPEGFRIHDYLEFQPSREQVLANREVRSKAGKKGAASKQGAKQSVKQNAQQGAKQTGNKSSAPYPVPGSRSSRSPEPAPPPGGEDEVAKKRRHQTVADVTMQLGREGFAPSDLTDALNRLDAELAVDPGRIESPVAWARSLAEKERDKREAAEKSKEPIYREFDGEKQVDRRDGRGWVRLDEEVSA
jgi:hypothetical protein